MAGRFEKGQHLFFLMRNGESSLDSQNKPRYYLSRDNAERCKHHTTEIVEYAPVTYGRWEYIPQTLDTLSQFRCSVCGWWSLDPSIDNAYNYCPNCGAKMDGGDGDE